jgi:hypothetical protein
MLRIMPPGGLPPGPPLGPGGPPPPGLPPGAPQPPDGQGLAPGKPKFDIQKVTQPVSGYMGPEMGPFECEHCHHFEDPGSCNIVSGAIDPHGCCNLFEKNDDQENGLEPDDGGSPPPLGPPPPPLPPGGSQ